MEFNRVKWIGKPSAHSQVLQQYADNTKNDSYDPTTKTLKIHKVSNRNEFPKGEFAFNPILDINRKKDIFNDL